MKLKSYFITIISMILIISLISPPVLVPLEAMAKAAPLWQKKFDGDIDWIIKTDFDTLVIGSNSKLYVASERGGELLWSVESGPEIKKNDVSMIDGTDLLLINRNYQDGLSYELQCYELLTGNILWENNDINGDGILVYPVLQRWAFLYLTDIDDGDDVRPRIYNIDVFNGETEWVSDFRNSFHGSQSSGILIFGTDYDVSGFYPPVFISDELYFFYDGIRKFDYKTGQELWSVSYEVNKEDELIRTDGDAIITDDVIYTSGAGIIRAIDRINGTVLWASEEFNESAVIPLIFYDEGRIYGQIGGKFLKNNYQDVKELDPAGVFCLDASNGNTLWEYWNIDDTITNIVPDSNRIYFSDKISLIALEKNTGEEIYKSTLDIANPVLTAVYEKQNALIVQSGQKVGSYDKETGHKNWLAGFKSQEPGFLDKLSNRLLIGAAIIVLTGGLATAVLLGSYIAYDINRSYNRNAAEDRLKRQAEAEEEYWAGADEYRNSPGFRKALEIRKERHKLLTEQSDVYFYVYGELERNEDIEGVGGINLDTGNMDFVIDLDEEKPSYFYDRIYGLLFYTEDEKIEAYKTYN